jgi:apoptosis-inducing factor 3
VGTEQSKPAGPELALGIPVDNLPDGHMLAGHVGDDAVLLGRRGDEFFAIGASCSHYGGPLAEGLMVEDTVCVSRRYRLDFGGKCAEGGPAEGRAMREIG